MFGGGTLHKGTIVGLVHIHHRLDNLYHVYSLLQVILGNYTTALVILTFVIVLSACLICDCAPPQPMPDMIMSTNVNTPASLIGIVMYFHPQCFKVFLNPNGTCMHKNKMFWQSWLSLKFRLFSSFSDQCQNNCDPSDCLLVQVEELQQVADRQVARHVLLCLLLTVSLFAVSKWPQTDL